MNRDIKLILIVLLISVSVIPVHAQGWKKGIQKLPKALGKKPPLTGTTPAVRPPVAPRVSPTVAAVAMPITPNTALNTMVERQVAQATVQVQTMAQLSKSKDFLTGVQILQTFQPEWRSELSLSGFTRQQLDLVEQAFKETDQFLFETDRAGNWLSPRSMEWDYTTRFAKILTDNAWGEMALNDGQIKTLFGKFSRLDDVFTRLNLQSFLLTHEGHAPKASAQGEEGRLARKATKYNLDKLDERKINKEMEEDIYEEQEKGIEQAMPAQLSVPVSSWRSVPAPSHTLRDRAPIRESEEVYEQILQFIKENNRFPSAGAEDLEEASLRWAFNYRCNQAEAQNLKDGASRRLLALKKQWVNIKIIDENKILEQVQRYRAKHNGSNPSLYSIDQKVKSLRMDWNMINAEYRGIPLENIENEAARELVQLHRNTIKGINNKNPKTILEHLQEYRAEHNGQHPSRRSVEEPARRLRKAWIRICKEYTDVLLEDIEDESSRELVRQYREITSVPN